MSRGKRPAKRGKGERKTDPSEKVPDWEIQLKASFSFSLHENKQETL